MLPAGASLGMQQLHECRGWVLWRQGKKGPHLGMDGTTPRDDACHTLGCQGDVPQENASMDGEVIHTLHASSSFALHVPFNVHAEQVQEASMIQ